jgi:hypothetical protein
VPPLLPCGSLLSFRFASPPSLPCPFLLKLTAASACMVSPTSKPLAPPLVLPFEAYFFPLAEPATPAAVGAPPPPESTPTTPYVASIDLAAHFANLSFPTPLPAFPGYPIPAVGQIQAVISNPHGHGVRLFVIPYDVRGMPVRHRMVLRQNVFEEVQDGQGGSQRRLRASATLHICCVEGNRPRSSTSDPAAKLSHSVPHTGLGTGTAVRPPPRYYLHSTIRFVFSNQPSVALPGDGPALRIATRTVVDMGAPAEGPSRFISWVDDDAVEYATIRQVRCFLPLCAKNGADRTLGSAILQIRKVQIKRLGHGADNVLPATGSGPAYISPATILGDTLPSASVEPSSSLPLPRQAESYALPPLARDLNHDLLPSPSLRSAPLPIPSPVNSQTPPPLAFAKVLSKATLSGRSSPVPPVSEESELSRRMRSLRVDQPGR